VTGSPLDWREPLALAALVLVPLLALGLAWARRRRQAALATFAEAGLLPALVPDLDARRRAVRAALLVGAVLLLVVAIAGPLWGFRWEEVHREGVDLVVAIDTSRSMLATDVKPTRLARAKLAVRDLLTQLHGDRVGLVAFAGSAFVQCPLTLDYGAVRQSLDAIDVGIIPKGGTALAEAIDTSLEAFEGREGKHQAIILITDGEDHEGKVNEAAARAAERGVKVYTVGLGTAEGELIPLGGGGFVKDRAGQVVKSRLDQETLQQIAVDTGGVYLHATGASLALTDLYRDYIGTMEKRELASTLERRFEHRFQVPLALALILLVADAFVGERRVARRRRRAAAGVDAVVLASIDRGGATAPRVRGKHGHAPATSPATAAGTAASAAATAARDERTGGAAAKGAGQHGVLMAALVLALASIAWLDPHARTREGNRLFAAGQYDDAAKEYNEALVDHPDSALLNFNLGDADYKQGKYDEAIAAYEQGRPGDDDAHASARTAYNLGNATYRRAEGAVATDPRKALEQYAAALVAYRRAIAAAPDDVDAKLNYELVMQKRAELQKKLEEQRQQQQQDQQQKDQQQQNEQQKQDQEKQDQQQQQQAGGDQQQQQKQQQGDEHQQAGGDQKQKDEAGADQQQAAQASPAPAASPGGDQQRAQAGEPHDQQQQNAAADNAEGAAAGDEPRDGEMTRQEAAALLDAQRGQEVQPGEVVRRLQGAVVAEPAQDW